MGTAASAPSSRATTPASGTERRRSKTPPRTAAAARGRGRPIPLLLLCSTAAVGMSSEAAAVRFAEEENFVLDDDEGRSRFLSPKEKKKASTRTATAAGDRDVATDGCSCAPASFRFAFSPRPSCLDDEVDSGPNGGVDGIFCSVYADDPTALGVVDLLPVSIRSVRILELGRDLRVVKHDSWEHLSLTTGDEISYESIAQTASSEDDRSSDSSERRSGLPGGLQIVLRGANSVGEPLTNVFLVTYKNYCESTPFQVGHRVGWTLLTEVERPPRRLCPLRSDRSAPKSTAVPSSSPTYDVERWDTYKLPEVFSSLPSSAPTTRTSMPSVVPSTGPSSRPSQERRSDDGAAVPAASPMASPTPLPSSPASEAPSPPPPTSEAPPSPPSDGRGKADRSGTRNATFPSSSSSPPATTRASSTSIPSRPGVDSKPPTPVPTTARPSVSSSKSSFRVGSKKERAKRSEGGSDESERDASGKGAGTDVERSKKRSSRDGGAPRGRRGKGAGKDESDGRRPGRGATPKSQSSSSTSDRSKEGTKTGRSRRRRSGRE